MSGALDKLAYVAVPGKSKEHRLKLYALSTCGFCKKAMKYLEERGLEFEYVYLDQIDFGLKREAKKELKEKFDNLPVFPILTIDDTEAISGFVVQKWKDKLGTE